MRRPPRLHPSQFGMVRPVIRVVTATSGSTRTRKPASAVTRRPTRTVWSLAIRSIPVGSAVGAGGAGGTERLFDLPRVGGRGYADRRVEASLSRVVRHPVEPEPAGPVAHAVVAS